MTININESLATKADLAAMAAELKAEIAELDTKMTTEIASVRTDIASVRTEIAALETKLTAKLATDKAELIRWIAASFVGNVVTMIAIAKFVAHP